jgi:uncharacterized tellurite resistance protein B-like protein
MIDVLKSLLKKREVSGQFARQAGVPGEQELQVATCVLLLEIAHADDEFLPAEEQKIEALMKSHFNLPEATVGDIRQAAERERNRSIDLYRFARALKQQYTTEQKEKIVEMLWSIIYTDAALDKHEDYLIHKLATLLGLDHRQLIDAKLKVLKKPAGGVQ